MACANPYVIIRALSVTQWTKTYWLLLSYKQPITNLWQYWLANYQFLIFLLSLHHSRFQKRHLKSLAKSTNKSYQTWNQIQIKHENEITTIPGQKNKRKRVTNTGHTHSPTLYSSRKSMPLIQSAANTHALFSPRKFLHSKYHSYWNSAPKRANSQRENACTLPLFVAGKHSAHFAHIRGYASVSLLHRPVKWLSSFREATLKHAKCLSIHIHNSTHTWQTLSAHSLINTSVVRRLIWLASKFCSVPACTSHILSQ